MNNHSVLQLFRVQDSLQDIYRKYLCIIRTPNFVLRNFRNKLLYKVRIDFLEFVAVKFCICPTFYWFIPTKIKNLH